MANMAVLQIHNDSSKISDNKMFTEDELLFLLSEQKWKNGFVCLKCGNDNYCKGKKPHSRRCTKCKAEESATAHTIFHHCKIPLVEAFTLAQIVCCNPKISTYEIIRQFEIRQMTCWKFKTHMMECLNDLENSPKLKELMQIYQQKSS